ncbi:MAG: WecB/TagA/CpsF family glycosyltransferase [Patescibacteria group bacterium]
MIDKKNILGVGITNITKNKVLEYIIKGLENFKEKYFVVTPNPEFLVLANKDSKFKNILNNAKLALADGIGIILAGKILDKPLKERITGVELLESLCKTVAEKPITVGFLGGGYGLAEKTAKCLIKKHPGLKVGFVAEEWPQDDTYLSGRFKNKGKKIINHKSYIINLPSIDILFVAFGTPKQEIWINDNLDKIPVKVAIGVGGAFDYISGRVPRAPLFVRQVGFEWLFRLIVQPWRVKRQLALLEFVFLVLKEKVKGVKVVDGTDKKA